MPDSKMKNRINSGNNGYKKTEMIPVHQNRLFLLFFMIMDL